MPRLKPNEVAAATAPLRTPAQLANDARLRAKRKKADNTIKNVAPAVIRPMVESQENPVATKEVREFNKDNELPHAKVEVPERRNKKGELQGVRGQRWMDDMAFANEFVTVRVHETTDKLANPFPEIWVQGRAQRFVRGHEQKVRRCYISRMAEMKLTTYDCVKTKDVNGEDVYRYLGRTGPVYDFTVIGDSEKGNQWLKDLLTRPG